MKKPVLNLGAWRDLEGAPGDVPLTMPAHHLVTHAVVVGMTGSGKTGLVTVLVEEAARAQVPALVVDVKGDLSNLLLRFPDSSPAAFEPWVEHDRDDLPPEELASRARDLAERHAAALRDWGLDQAAVAAYAAGTHVRVLTPGSSGGEPLHMLSALERASSRWQSDPEVARDALSASVSLVLRLLGRESDPAKSREHVLLSVLAERRLLAGQSAELGALMEDVLEPPMAEIGALPVSSFMKPTERRALAASLNNLLASPTLASWREGADLDVAAWMKPVDGKTPITLVNVSQLDDEERTLVLSVLLEEYLSWVRTLSGSQHLRALLVFDEIYGFLPPHPANPPTKRPLVALMKQARGFGVGVIVATQNPMDLDYRALSNAGVWCLGRLQTDADRERVLDGLATAQGSPGELTPALDATIKRLAPRWFLVRNAHSSQAPILLHPRHAISLLRGPMTRVELRRAREALQAEGAGPMTPRMRAATEPPVSDASLDGAAE